MSDNGQSIIVPVSAAAQAGVLARPVLLSENGRNPPLSPLGTGRADHSAQGFILVQGVKEMIKSMAKFEAVAFAFGFLATGFLTLVAIPLA